MTSTSRFLRACRRQPVDRPPVWLMRQAGRYLPEYRAVRERYPFLTMCKTPELAAEITLQPIRRYNFDAAIVFADILLLLEAMGLDLHFSEEEGPIIANPVASLRDVRALRPVDPESDLGFVLGAIRIVKRELIGTPLIGFAGAPFTLASYAVAGRGSRDFAEVKTFLWERPDVFAELLDRLATATIDYLRAQVHAGASAIQLFDSWAGALSPGDYRTHVLPHTERVLNALSELGVPVSHFALGTTPYIELVASAGGDVLSVDWHIDLREARRRTEGRLALQGNLDPTLLLTTPDIVAAHTRRLLEDWGDAPGLIVNLGHGIDRRTPLENVAALVNTVRDYRPPERRTTG
jgi:uroporphyrinogen decarboxylase